LNQFIINGDQGAPEFIFAHGAGAAMDSDFMTIVAEGLAAKGIRVIRFEFEYMQKQRETGKRRPPDRQPKLLEYYQTVIDSLGLKNPVIGGKSMGGRMSTIFASENIFAGVAVFGYPFHALGKPEKVRVDHFCSLTCPVLICQGERDAMGNQSDVAQYRIPDNIKVEWFVDGDHDLKPRKASGQTHDGNLQSAIEKVSQFIHEVTAR